MSDYKIIAAVTAALKHVLQTVGNLVDPSCDIRLGPPTARLGEESASRINLFLFRSSPNAGQRNAHLPTHRTDGGRRRRSETAIDLHYILSFFGDAKAYVPDRLLGAVTIALEQVPALFDSAVASALATSELDPLDADAAGALARVRIAPETLSLEDFSKIWSIFFQVPYALSAVYVCSHVVLESRQALGETLPVVRRDIYSGPVSGFSLLWAGADESGAGPVQWDGPLHLAGKGLGRLGTALRIDGEPAAALDPGALSDHAIRATLDAALAGAELAAGIHVAQALAPPASPTTPPHLVRSTNAVPFALHPAIVEVAPAAGPPGAGTIAVKFKPAVAKGQAVTLTLDKDDVLHPHQIVLDPDIPDSPPPGFFPAGTLTFPYSDLPGGDYLVRAHVDGLASLPEVETDPLSPEFGRIIGPRASI